MVELDDICDLFNLNDSMIDSSCSEVLGYLVLGSPVFCLGGEGTFLVVCARFCKAF